MVGVRMAGNKGLFRAGLLWMSGLVALVPAARAEDGAGFAVLHHEPLTELRFDTTAAPGVTAKTGAPGVRVSFIAFGKSFQLELEENRRLLRGLAAHRPVSGYELYRGHLAGAPESWVRLTRFGGELRGMIWDGAELHVIEAATQVAKFAGVPTPADSSAPVIYRLSDTVAVEFPPPPTSSSPSCCPRDWTSSRRAPRRRTAPSAPTR